MCSHSTEGIVLCTIPLMQPDLQENNLVRLGQQSQCKVGTSCSLLQVVQICGQHSKNPTHTGCAPFAVHTYINLSNTAHLIYFRGLIS